MSITVHTPQTLPSNDNINEYGFCIDVTSDTFIRRGKMVAYYGQLRFESMWAPQYEVMSSQVFGAPDYVNEFAVVTGRGKLLLGDRGNHICSFDLEDGNLTVRAANLLAFQNLEVQQSTMPGFLTLLGTGKFIASSNGMVHFLETPAQVDPDALLGWVDCPCPSYTFDYAYIRTLVGLVGAAAGITATGEEKQVNFVGKGTILVQSSEQGLIGNADVQNIVSRLPGFSNGDLGTISSSISSVLQQRRS